MSDWYKYRCTECRQEPKHVVLHKGKEVKLGSCECKGQRTLEMVPLTKEKYFARLR